MKASSQTGFTLVEVLIALTILMVAVVPVLWICGAAQRLTRSQSEASDLQQRARVLVEKLQRDLIVAGAGPPDTGIRLVDLVPTLVPARIGFRSPDPEASAFADRLSILYVPADGWQAALATPMTSPAAAIAIDATAIGCPAAGLCGFTEDARALIVDTRAPGAGFELFTVSGIAGELAHAAPNAPFSQAYANPSARVMPIVQRTYYFDRASRRLMIYDGHLSDVPLIDNVADVRFEYYTDMSPGPGLRAVPLSELSDGPLIGLPPNRFDADLRAIRLVRVIIRLEADADDVRGAGELFARPGRSNSGLALVPDFEMTFEVAPRNMRASP